MTSKPAGYPAAKDIDAAMIVMVCILLGTVIVGWTVLVG
jgi:hypothetical protein